MIVNLNPTIAKIGPFEIRWYGLMYVIGFIITLIYLSIIFKKKYLKERFNLPEDLEWDLILWGAVGVLIGGRLGFVLIYNFSYYLHNPLKILYTFEGGMSFHGALLGVILAIWLYLKYKKIDFYGLADAIVVIIPITLFFGRLGNFINGELYGRPSHVPWAMVFPRYGGDVPRHPSQLYEALLEGLVLFLILYFMEKAQRKKHKIEKGVVFWTFIGGYGLFRFFVEFFREPDKYWGNNGFILGPFTMGQILSFPMFLLGIVMIYLLQTRKVYFPDLVYSGKTKSKEKQEIKVWKKKKKKK